MPTPARPQRDEIAEPCCSICGSSPARIRTHLPNRPHETNLCAECANEIGDAVHKVIMARHQLRRKAS